MLVEEVVW